MRPIVWTIAGSDSGGGAGIQADLHTLQAFGMHGCSVITAITAQNSQTVSAIECVSPKTLAAQLQALNDDLPAKAIKIGMIGNADSIEIIADFLKEYHGFVVFDPVMLSSSGVTLVSSKCQKHFLKKIMPRVSLMTPNLLEAEKLSHCSINSMQDMQFAAQQLCKLGAKNVYLKGGHFIQQFAQDYFYNETEAFWLSHERIQPLNTHGNIHWNNHGSGCSLSTAIAACVAKGFCLKDALVIAKMYVTQGIRAAKPIGQGPGPVQHLGFPSRQIDLPYLHYANKRIYYNFPRCKNIGFYPIVNRSNWLEKLLPLGVKTIQLRIKDLQGFELESEIKKSVIIANKFKAQLFINDYWDLAIKHDAFGVHLGQEDLVDANLAEIERAGLHLGISTHSYYEVARAHAIKPSYIACGSIYPTTSKEMAFLPLGLESLWRWRNMLNYPLVAIGGINYERAKAVIKTGVEGIAVISAVTKADDPITLTKQFLELFDDEPL